MLKFRFPTTKRNTQEQQQQQQQQQNESEQEQEHSIPTPSPSPSNSSNYQQQQQNSLTINHPTLIQSTDSVDHTIPIEEHSLPINLNLNNTNNNNNNNNRDSTHTNVSRKIRRKSYGGLRAMLGINKQDDHQNQSPPPPLPSAPSSACSTNFQHQQLVQQQQHLHRHHKHNPSLDASSSTSSLSNLGPLPSSPSTSEPRQTTSSLRPFPFLGGIRRKSANASNVKSPHPLTTQTNEPLPSNYLSPSNPQSPSSSTLVSNNNNNNNNNKTRNSKIKVTDHSTRVYGNGSSKKAQSVDDLSQFGLLRKPRIQPRRSEELTEHRPAGPSGSSSASADDTGRASDLHNGLDQIGEMAGSLAAINGASTDDRMPPRLSNPKGMRTVYGVPIEDLYWRDGDSFPLLVNVLVELIEEKGLDQQGIYRVPGEKRVIENLQASIDERGVRGVDIWRDSYRDVHNLSGALKLFLREIPGGVIPFDRYDRFLAVNGIPDDSERTTQLQCHVKELPLPNKILLLKLIKHFERVVEHAEANSMLVHNVAIVFAPSLFRNGSEHSNPLLSMQNIGKASAIVRHFVMNAAQIFEETSEELLKQAAMETVRAQKEKKQQQGHKRRSINMNLSYYQQQQQHPSPQFSNTQVRKPKDDGLQSKRASISSVVTNTTTATTEEHRRSRRGSATLAKQKSGNTSSSKRNTGRTNSALSSTTKPAKVNNRHSLTGSILTTSTSKSSKASPVNNSPHSSVASTSIIFPSPNQNHTTSPINSATPDTTITSSSPTTTTTTPHPTLGFSNLTVRKKAK